MPLPTTRRAACSIAYLVDRTGEQAAVKGESAALGVRKPRACRWHTMEENKPPIYIIAPGKVYRYDVADPSYLPQFHQVEGPDCRQAFRLAT